MSATETRDGEQLLTIGAVCERLKPEFPDISISKIRYLEGEGLVNPQRTQGGYRLFSEEDVDLLETILRLQRDEFLPLRVIRQELASPAAKERRRAKPRTLGTESELDLGELCERGGIDLQYARELEDFGLLQPRIEGGERLYSESDCDIAATCGELARFGLSPRHLRQFRTAADREADLLEAVVAPALRSRNPERRQQGAADLKLLGELAQDLAQRLFWRDLRRLVS
jgi:DNA-binding transcriptional MerR regulator